MRRILCLLLLSACAGNGTPLPPADPVLGARHGHAMTFDEAHGQLLLFGGTEGGEHKPDLWRWTGDAWMRLAEGGPGPRSDASLAYDASRQRVVLFGGRAGQFPNETIRTDTWEWDGGSWTQRATTGPSPRVHQSMAYDRARQRVVLYGGFSVVSNQELRDVWEWNGTAWTQAGAAVPPDRIARGVAFDEAGSRLLLISAQESGTGVFVDSWDGSVIAPVTGAAPGCAPQAGALASLAASGVFFFGCAGPATDAQWRFASGTWTQPGGAPPPARTGHALAYDRARQAVVMYGGVSPSDVPLADTWERNGATWTLEAGAAAQISVGGAYSTVVSMIADSCAGTVIQNNPTTITHTPGSTTFTLAHAVIQAAGTIGANATFTTAPLVLPLGGTNYHINMTGQFTATGLTARVHLSVGDPGSAGRCGYTVQWTGTKQGVPNVIP